MIHRVQKSIFSLVELLVIISILAIMASFLQPTLSNMTIHATTIACKSNLRYIGTTIISYTMDHYYYPVNQQKKPNTNFLYISWDDSLGQGYDGRNLSFDDIKKPKCSEPYPLYECPQQKPLYNNSGYIRSYVMNCNQGSSNNGGISSLWGAGSGSVNVDEVYIPSETILLTEKEGKLGSGYSSGIYGANDQKNYLNSKPDASHNSMFNYLFCDGHVSLYLTDETRNPDKNDWYCGKFWTRNPND
ncbi:MAG: hypothetical protein HQL32_08320 [Planctomycetes bacterium]|nr:hypothetical protein [Planctomycetota bacterium]